MEYTWTTALALQAASGLADRLGATTGYAGVYRQRLLRAGMILPAGRGRLTLAHHTARDWLRQQATETDW